ncbi:uncharacterized protein BJ212DRAFT_1335530 [Suillus subaureus]|uniref:Uncharacterized protein n=1 Tax=Suillus subaureus TaxID=48587 RepID=A0A9P7JGR1_9AGAM|nr:uncharacterized protein BJ212DRAFT_1335530 [Suillus subaureus]KAG1822051.1 hypothetical protein BJ212DRAFT_1335530 [Suillus subaureus]
MFYLLKTFKLMRFLSSLPLPHYTLAAELHQLTSPKTAPTFLDSLLENAEHAGKALDETALFGSYNWNSWRGIVRSFWGVGLILRCVVLGCCSYDILMLLLHGYIV